MSGRPPRKSDVAPRAPVRNLLTARREPRPRSTKATRASLLMHAGFARDQSVTIATFAGIELEGVSAFDNAIRAGWDRLDEEIDAE